MATRKDPYVNFNFLVEIDGIVRAAFHEAGGLDSSDRCDRAPRGRREHHDAQTARTGEVLEHQPQVGDDRRHSICTTGIDSGSTGDPAAARKNGSIVLLDRQGQEKARWNFFNGWPSKWTGPDFNAEGQRHRDRDARDRARRTGTRVMQ